MKSVNPFFQLRQNNMRYILSLYLQIFAFSLFEYEKNFCNFEFFLYNFI